LLIPLLGGINFNSLIFVLGLYGGFYIDIPIPFNNIYKNSFAGTEDVFERNILFGYAAGGSAGIKLGPGIVFLDVRYMGDFINANTTINNIPMEIYKRRIIAFGVGYKIGLLNQKR
jgi:hypothetical protein